MIDVDDDDNVKVKTIELTNRMWFTGVVFTRNDNEMRYHSDQNDADSRGSHEAQPSEFIIISTSKTLFFPEKGIALHLKRAALSGLLSTTAN